MGLGAAQTVIPRHPTCSTSFSTFVKYGGTVRPRILQMLTASMPLELADIHGNLEGHCNRASIISYMRRVSLVFDPRNLKLKRLQRVGNPFCTVRLKQNFRGARGKRRDGVVDPRKSVQTRGARARTPDCNQTE